MCGRTAENGSRRPTRTTAVEAAGSLASGGRSSDEKQNYTMLGTGKAKKVYKSTSTSGSGDSAASSFVFNERNGDPANSAFESRRQSTEGDRRCREARMGLWRGIISTVHRRQKEVAEAENRVEQAVAGSGGGCGRKAAASVLRETGVAAAIEGGRGSTWSEAVTRGSPRRRRASKIRRQRQHKIRGGDGGVPPSAPPSESKWAWQRRGQRAARREGPPDSSGETAGGKAERAEARRSGRG